MLISRAGIQRTEWSVGIIAPSRALDFSTSGWLGGCCSGVWGTLLSTSFILVGVCLRRWDYGAVRWRFAAGEVLPFRSPWRLCWGCFVGHPGRVGVQCRGWMVSQVECEVGLALGGVVGVSVVGATRRAIPVPA